MIVGTAGHIDHGKTTLIRALTGVDTDRLPEEKQRGISIELGYAFMDAAGAGPSDPPRRIGFIDVPGHERLVHTMVAGATGIDFALLLVAADDGVMPQTREHLAVLSLLGLDRGIVAITKTDRADAARTAAVEAEVRALLAGTALDGAPVVRVAALRGDGIAELRALLEQAARRTVPADPSAAAFRLAVDRVFTLQGVGTVVTGTVHAGQVQVGDELVLAPTAATSPPRLRVRSVHAQNQAAGSGRAGQRCALALAGVAKDEIARGQWLVAPEVALSTDRIDVTLTLWPGEARALRSGTPVVVHLGAGAELGSVALLDGDDRLAPGATARAQLVMRRPIAAWHGERALLRDASASRAVAGGRVLDPFAPARYRRTAQRLAELDALALPTAAARLQALLTVAPLGVDRRRFAGGQGIATVALATEPGSLNSAEWALGPSQTAAARAAVIASLERFHTTHPDDPGPDAARLRRLALPRLPEPLWRALLDRLRTDGELTGSGAFVHRPAHGVALSATEQRIAQKTAPALAEAGFDGAWARDLARDSGESEALVRTTLSRLAQRGDLHQVVKDLFYPAPTMATLAAVARRLADEADAAATGNGGFTAATFRDATGLGRKRAIQIIEYFDRVGLLRRVGDRHKRRADSQLFDADAP
jgi:selenocysteine-specific elongation factor